MNVSRAQTDGTAIQTGRLMHRMVDQYHTDMLPWAHCTFPEIFSVIKNIPFRFDPPGEETLQRPLYTMQERGAGGDCDDKCIALASWCKLNSIPYRFIAVRRSDAPGLHHVLCYVYINGIWVHADPTYAFNTLGREREPYAEYVDI